MLFNSIEFLIFFPIVFLIYFIVPHKHRWIILLFASYFFYISWKIEYLFILIVSTTIDYFSAIKIAESKTNSKKKFFLYLSLASNLGLLFAFKYFNFISSEIQNLLNTFGVQFDFPYSNLLLPIGISFYTFQTLGYTIDVYNNKIKPEKHWGHFAAFVSFFPQLVAGPIERAGNLLPQFKKLVIFNYQDITNGAKLILWGFFKKMVIADSLAIGVDVIFNNPTNFTGFSLIIATVFFAFQIYCDFSGYCDIAIGLAQMLGFNLMDNFKRPYHAKSISDFWKRWHISLSTWFKDYLYIPLGGNRVPVRRLYLNLIIVFVVSGFWHGANWTFIIWGALHGFYLISSLVFKDIRKNLVFLLHLNKFPKILNVLNIFFTFTLVNLAWIFFRANSMQDAYYIITHIFSDISFDLYSLTLTVGVMWFLKSVILIIFMEFIHLMQRHISMRKFFSEKPIYIRWPIYITIITMILLFGVYEKIEFIYFQF